MTQVWRVELLGQLKLIGPYGRVERFQTKKTEELLACLVLFRHQPQSREQLIERLWPDVDPAVGRNRLSQALSWLRGRLEPSEVPPGSVLLADRTRVSLSAEVVASDVATFEQELLREISPATLALYTADLLVDHDAEWIVTARQELRDRYVKAAQALARRSDNTLAEATLRQALAHAPLSEDLHADLLQRLMATRQLGAAQRHFHEYERLLERTLGLAPSSELRSLLHVTLPHPAPPLPNPLTEFVGRDEELGRLGALLHPEGPRLVTITGLGGTGKTRFALEGANRAWDLFQGQVWLVPLGEIELPIHVPTALAETLSLSVSPQTSPLDSVLKALQGRPVLLILDGLEHLGEGLVPLLRRLLERLPMLHLLATSRIRLGLDGEREISIPPLSLEMSAQLFVTRASALAPDFSFRSENEAELTTLCQHLEGWPLAIELCAAWIQTLSLREMSAYLIRRFELLVSRRQDIPERHRTLRATIESSYLQLSPSLQELFVTLSVFRGGWSLEGAVAICSTEADPLAMVRHLTMLRERALILVEPRAGGQTRYRMLETLRVFAEEQLPHARELLLRQSHARYYLALVESVQSQLLGPEQGLHLMRLTEEYENLRSVLAWCVECQEADFGLRLLSALAPFWEFRGYAEEGLRWIERILDFARGGAPSLLGGAYHAQGVLARSQGEYALALEAAEKALGCYYRAENLGGQAGTLSLLGTLMYLREDYAAAQAYLDEALEIARRIDDPHRIAGVLQNQGNVAMEEHNWSRARDSFEAALRLYRILGHQSGIAGSLNNLALVARYQNEYTLAHSLLEEAQGIHRNLKNPASIAVALLNLSTVCRLSDQMPQAQSVLEEAVAFAREAGERRVLAWCAKERGHQFCALGRWKDGARWLALSEHQRQTLGMTFRPADPAALEHDKKRLREALGEEPLAQLWKEGEYLGLDEI